MSSDEFKFVTPGMFDYLDKKRDVLEARRQEAGVQARWEETLSVNWPHNDCGLDGVAASTLDRALRNYREALQILIPMTKFPVLDVDSIKRVHARMMAGLSEEAGEFRGGDMAPLTPEHDPPDPRAVAWSVHHLLDWTAADSFAELHAIQQAALVLVRLLDIAPFTDGSARTCRCIANFYLIKAQFPPAILTPQEEASYRGAVNAGLTMDTTPLTTLLANAVARTMDFCLHGSAKEPR